MRIVKRKSDATRRGNALRSACNRQGSDEELQKEES